MSGTDSPVSTATSVTVTAEGRTVPEGHLTSTLPPPPPPPPSVKYVPSLPHAAWRTTVTSPLRSLDVSGAPEDAPEPQLPSYIQSPPLASPAGFTASTRAMGANTGMARLNSNLSTRAPMNLQEGASFVSPLYGMQSQIPLESLAGTQVPVVPPPPSWIAQAAFVAPAGGYPDVGSGALPVYGYGCDPYVAAYGSIPFPPDENQYFDEYGGFGDDEWTGDTDGGFFDPYGAGSSYDAYGAAAYGDPSSLPPLPLPPPPLNNAHPVRFDMLNPLHASNMHADRHITAVMRDPLATPAVVRYAEQEAAAEKDHTNVVTTASRLPAIQQKQRPPWRPASLTIAEAYEDDHHPRWTDEKGRKRRYRVCRTKLGRFWCVVCRRCDPCCEGVASELSQFGPGITSYFKTLKALAWCLGFMTVLALPSLALNLFGRESVPTADAVGLYQTTVGNLGVTFNNTNFYIPFSSCVDNQTIASTVACTISPSLAGLIYSCADVAGMVALVCCYLFIKLSSNAEGASGREDALSVDMYTVMVSSIPRCADEKSLTDHFASTTGCKIADVVVAEDESHLIGLFMRRGRLVKQLEQHENAIWKYTTLEKHRLLQRHKARRDKLVERIRSIKAQQQKLPPSRGALRAFVTFEDKSGRAAALRLFPASWLRRQFTKEQLQYKAPDGKPYRISAVPGPPPSVILWENLAVSWHSRLLRRGATALISVILLAVSSAFIYVASIKAAEYTRDQQPQNCPATVSAVEAGSSPFLRGCYCSSLPSTTAIADSICAVWLQSEGYVLALQNVASLIVAVVNMLLVQALTRLTRFERHHSIDKMQLSLSTRIFLAQFVNTAFLSLVLRADIPFLPSSGIRYSDFEPGWYSTVGRSIIVTLLFNIISPHLSVLAYLGFSRCYQCIRGAHGARSQRELNLRLLGPEFNLSTRYAQVMNTIASTITYSTGMPILLPIAVVQLCMTYWIDKWLFLRFFRTPPRYGISLGISMVELIPLSVAVHAAFGFWMLTFPNLFPSNAVSVTEISSTASSLNIPFLGRLQVLATIPLVLLLACVVAAIFLRGFVSAIISVGAKCCIILSCGKIGNPANGSGKRKSQAQEMSFSTARLSRKLMGIPSYSILMNPRFTQAFAISRTFAATHKRVSDIFQDDATIGARNLMDIELAGLPALDKPAATEGDPK